MVNFIHAAATRTGTQDPNCDRFAFHAGTRGNLAASVIDGSGHSEEIAEAMHLVAHVAVRIGVQRGVMAGLMSGAALVADRGPNLERPTGVAVLAIAYADSTDVAWIGDARAYGWDGNALTQYTTDQTIGEQLSRHSGIPVETARAYSPWLATSLAHAVVATIGQVQIPAGHTVILTSDGVHDAVEHDRLVEIVHRYADDPQALADALVAAPRPDSNGERDDATAAVIALSPRD